MVNGAFALVVCHVLLGVRTGNSVACHRSMLVDALAKGWRTKSLFLAPCSEASHLYTQVVLTSPPVAP